MSIGIKASVRLWRNLFTCFGTGLSIPSLSNPDDLADSVCFWQFGDIDAGSSMSGYVPFSDRQSMAPYIADITRLRPNGPSTVLRLAL